MTLEEYATEIARYMPRGLADAILVTYDRYAVNNSRANAILPTFDEHWVAIVEAESNTFPLGNLLAPESMLVRSDFNEVGRAVVNALVELRSQHATAQKED